MEWNKLLCKDRVRRSTNPGDYRLEFERDFDRAIFSTPLKRLQDKTQVFPLDPNDAVRTRLTHSLEVSSVARGLAMAVAKWLLSDENKILIPGQDRQIEAIAATCGLIHDLGNPPFGHSGEDAIRDWFRNRIGEKNLERWLNYNAQLVQDFLNFESNAQTLRLVTKLQLLADYNGLNLTYGTLSASCKYIAPSNAVGLEDDHAKSKPGYFSSENEIVKQIHKMTGTGNARNPITYLVEAADDIVYSVADIEDAVKKGIFTWSYAEEYLKKTKTPFVYEALQVAKNILRGGEKSIPRGLPDDVKASAFRTAAIGIIANAVAKAFQDNYDLIMCGQYKKELVKDCAAAPLVKSLKKLGQEHVYNTPSNLKLEIMGRTVIFDLMDIFWEGAESLPKVGSPNTKTFPGKIGALLSENYRKVFCHFVKESQGLPEQYYRLQLVTDYVCGMTDTFAKRLHTELMNG